MFCCACAGYLALLGQRKTPRKTLANCLHSSAGAQVRCGALCAFFVAGSVRPGFVTASNVTACRAAAGKLARIDCVLTAFEPAALREQIAHVTPHHARPAPLWAVWSLSIGFCPLAPVARVLEPCGEPRNSALFYCVRKFLAPLPICPAYRAFSLCFDVSFCWCRVSTGATC